MQFSTRRAPASADRTLRTFHFLGAFALALGLSGAALTAHAQSPSDACDKATTILQNAYPDARPDPDRIQPASYLLGKHRLMMPGQPSGDAPSMVCKVWPAHDKLLLVAVPRMDANAPLDQDRVGDLDILVVARDSLKVQQRITLLNAMSDDAIRIERLEFDTARYVIAPGVQAFGLRTTRNSASRANPFNEVSLSLFAMRDGGSGPLRMVLDKLSVTRAGGQWDTNCAGEYTEHKVVLAMTGNQHHGFHDIRASRESVSSKAVLTGRDKTDCKETAGKTMRTQHTLAHDGTHYVVPDELKSL